jgi:acyl-CoA dehydrogenase
LGDVLSFLYIASAALKRFETQGRPAEDLPLVAWACEDALCKAETRLAGLLRNFPNRAVAALLRFLIFPLGRHIVGPSDALGHQVAQLLTAHTASRDRLTAGVYAQGNDAVGMMNEALKLAVRTEPASKTLHVAQRDGKLRAHGREALVAEAEEAGIVSSADAKALRRLDALTEEIIAVDDFAQHELGVEAKTRARRRKRRARARARAEAPPDITPEIGREDNKPLRKASG